MLLWHEYLARNLKLLLVEPTPRSHNSSPSCCFSLAGLVLAWTHAITNGNGDIAVVVEPDGLAPEGGACPADNEHGDEEAGGWPRFFTPMAHLCVFSSQQVWNAACMDLSLSPRK